MVKPHQVGWRHGQQVLGRDGTAGAGGNLRGFAYDNRPPSIVQPDLGPGAFCHHIGKLSMLVEG